MAVEGVKAQVTNLRQQGTPVTQAGARRGLKPADLKMKL